MGGSWYAIQERIREPIRELVTIIGTQYTF
jgi:hypothetical protein